MAVVESFPTRAEQLALEPGIPAGARAGLREGAALFDARRFWDAHEAWEEIWQVEPRSIRSFYQGLIQIAAGFHHWTATRRPRGVQTLLAAGVAKLEWYAPGYLGVDVRRTIDEALRLRSLADGHDVAWLDAFPRNSLPPFYWLQQASPAQPPLEPGTGGPYARPMPAQPISEPIHENDALQPGSPPLRVRLLRETARLPHRATPHSAGLDLFADFGHDGGAIVLTAVPRLVPTGLSLEVPPGFEVQIRPRSGLSRRGVVVAFGTVDADYRGEVRVNMSVPAAGEFLVRQGDRIAQLVVAPVALSVVEQVDALSDTTRGAGGFGSTGR